MIRAAAAALFVASKNNYLVIWASSPHFDHRQNEGSEFRVEGENMINKDSPCLEVRIIH